MKTKIVMKKEVKIKPRNPVIMALAKRNGAGSHERPHKSLRTREKSQLKKEFSF